MKKTIEDLAYLIKQSEKNGEPKPIVLLGAGASVSGGIPLAGGIIKRILEDFKDKPAIGRLSDDKKGNYYELMAALSPRERRKIFNEYISEAKVNVGHIYLAQLIKEGYIDYVLTVNFDDLLPRACGLFNYTMPTYDISNVKDFTTNGFENKSIIYLHGQHYGEWLLNSKGELDKVKDRIPILLNKICQNRTWIIVGYSGEDEVFDEINKFSNFDNELYWVGYLNYQPSKKVQNSLLNVPTKNAQLISGYDADTFFLDLHSKLDLKTPQILEKPFSFLEEMIKEVSIPKLDDTIDEHKELYESLSERMYITKKWIDKAKEEIQEGDSLEKFKQEIIQAVLNEDFNEDLALSFKHTIENKGYEKAKEQLSWYYGRWGMNIVKKARLKEEEELYKQSLDKYEKSIELNSNLASTYNNYGNALSFMAGLKLDSDLYEKSFIQYQKSIELNDKKALTYNNYGSALLELAKLTSNLELYEKSFDQYEKSIGVDDKQAFIYNNYAFALLDLAELTPDLDLYKKIFVQYERSIELNDKDPFVYYNYGSALSALAKLTSNPELYKKSFIQYRKSIKLNNQDASIYNNYGNALSALAKLISDSDLYEKSFIQYKKSIELDDKDASVYNNYGNTLLDSYDLKKENNELFDNSILLKAKDLIFKAYELDGNPYNLSCVYALLDDKIKALRYLKETLEKNLVTSKHILQDEDWKGYLQDKDFIALLESY